MEVLGHEYNPDKWHLFIDLSKVSLKVVLLHNGNRFPSVPMAHAANMKESYESIWENITMTNLSESYVVITRLWRYYRNATRVNKTLLFPVRVEQPGQDESLCK